MYIIFAKHEIFIAIVLNDNKFAGNLTPDKLGKLNCQPTSKKITGTWAGVTT